MTTRPGPSGIKTKGAVAVCFHIFGSSFLFINAHFTGSLFASSSLILKIVVILDSDVVADGNDGGAVQANLASYPQRDGK